MIYLVKAAFYAAMAMLALPLIDKFVDNTYSSEETLELLRQILLEENGVEPTEEDIKKDIQYTKNRLTNIAIILYTIVICFLIMRGVL